MNNCYEQVQKDALNCLSVLVCIIVSSVMAHQIFRNILGFIPETQLSNTIKAALMRYYSPAHGMMVS